MTCSFPIASSTQQLTKIFLVPQWTSWFCFHWQEPKLRNFLFRSSCLYFPPGVCHSYWHVVFNAVDLPVFCSNHMYRDQGVWVKSWNMVLKLNSTLDLWCKERVMPWLWFWVNILRLTCFMAVGILPQIGLWESINISLTPRLTGMNLAVVE